MGASGVPKGPRGYLILSRCLNLTFFIAEGVVGGMLRTSNLSMMCIINTTVHLRRRRAWNRGLCITAQHEYEPVMVERVRQLRDRLGEQRVLMLGQWLNYLM